MGKAVGLTKVCPFKIRCLQDDPMEMCSPQVRLVEVSACEVSSLQMGLPELGFLQSGITLWS